MSAGELGLIDTPAQRMSRPAGVTWAADNGCFGKGWPGDVAWWSWLVSHACDASSCAWATAPDVVGDAAATWERSAAWLPRIRQLGYPAALVAQDGLTPSSTPWAELDVLFIGGTTDWKLGADVRALIREAHRRGVWVHMGRVNSARRYRYADWLGCASVDGTYLTYGPDVNLPKLNSWQEPTLDMTQPDLWGSVVADGPASPPTYPCCGHCAPTHPNHKPPHRTRCEACRKYQG